MDTLDDLADLAEFAAEDGALGNYANNSSPSRRKARYMALSGLWRTSRLERVRKCRKVSRLANGGVEYRLRDGHGGLAGLASCGSVWACPVCNAKVMQRRAFELGALVAAAQAQGLRVIEVTLTLRHDQGDSLADLWAAISTCWDRAKSGKAWVSAAKRHDVVGWLRVVEVTHGVNGWHPHVHALLFARSIDAAGASDLVGGVINRWQKAAVRLGLRSPLAAVQEWHFLGDRAHSAIADYLTAGKVYAGRETSTAIGLELTSTQSKRARSVHSTRSTWELLNDALNGETAGLARWWEWERVSSGKRQISYSQGLRELLGLADLLKASDEEIAAEELGTADDAGLLVTPAGWARMTGNPDWIPDSLTVLEQVGWGALAGYLEERAVEFVALEAQGVGR